MKRIMPLLAFWFILFFTLLSPPVFSQDPEMEKLVQGNSQFAIKLYKRIHTTETGNIFFSPYSISTAAAMTYGGARGDTARQMVDVLYFPLEDEKLHTAFAAIQSRLNQIQKSRKIELYIANSLWPQNRYRFLEEYLKLVRNSYGAEIEPVDYAGNPEAARMKINAWVEKKTKDRIQDILPDASPLTPLTRLVLANAIYFKGEWAAQFEKSATEEMPFYLSKDKATQVPMMMQEQYFNYGEDEILQVLELPYIGNELSMVVLLPKEIEGLHNLEEKLTADSLKEWSGDTYEELVEVYLPRFKITFEFDLKKVLESMGMTDAFASNKADFSGMDGKSDWLYIGFAKHKAFVDVDEEGTRAAAVTVGGGCFPAGTEVLTAAGPRAIETIATGTKVYACDPATGEWIAAQVLERQEHQYSGDMITIQAGNIKIEATGNHPFYVLQGNSLTSRPLAQDVPKAEQRTVKTGRWVEARDLIIGDVLKARSGEDLIITGLSSRSEKNVVYNLDVDGRHNYAIHRKGILVHNKGSMEPEPIIFRADHPFLFLIRDNQTESILFMGRVSNPSEIK